jgi:hypothetical protein
MNNSTKAQAKTAKNYSQEQENFLKSHDSLSYDDCVTIAESFGKSVQSVVSKVLSMEIPYVPKEKPKKRVSGKTKAEIVGEIEKKLELEYCKLSGLEKATAQALNNLVNSLP